MSQSKTLDASISLTEHDSHASRIGGPDYRASILSHAIQGQLHQRIHLLTGGR